MPIVPCPNCPESVEIDSDDYGYRVTCPSCGHRFVAERPLNIRDADDQPRRQRSRSDDRPRSTSKVVGVVLAAVILVLLLVCGGCIGFIVYVNTAKESFDGPWSDQSVNLQDVAIVTASFPRPAISEPLNDPSGSGTGTMIAYSNMDQGGSVKDAVFMIGSIDYPAGSANPLDRGYLPIRETIAERFVSNPLTKPVVKKESTTTINGYPAKEVEYSDEDGNFTLRVIHLNDRPKNATQRLIVVFAGGTAMKDTDKQKFLQSVRINSGK